MVAETRSSRKKAPDIAAYQSWGEDQIRLRPTLNKTVLKTVHDREARIFGEHSQEHIDAVKEAISSEFPLKEKKGKKKAAQGQLEPAATSSSSKKAGKAKEVENSEDASRQDSKKSKTEPRKREEPPVYRKPNVEDAEDEDPPRYERPYTRQMKRREEDAANDSTRQAQSNRPSEDQRTRQQSRASGENLNRSDSPVASSSKHPIPVNDGELMDKEELKAQLEKIRKEKQKNRTKTSAVQERSGLQRLNPLVNDDSGRKKTGKAKPGSQASQALVPQAFDGRGFEKREPRQPPLEIVPQTREEYEPQMREDFDDDSSAGTESVSGKAQSDISMPTVGGERDILGEDDPMISSLVDPFSRAYGTRQNERISLEYPPRREREREVDETRRVVEEPDESEDELVEEMDSDDDAESDGDEMPLMAPAHLTGNLNAALMLKEYPLYFRQHKISSKEPTHFRYLDYVSKTWVDAWIHYVTPKQALCVSFQGRNPKYRNVRAGALVKGSAYRKAKKDFVAAGGPVAVHREAATFEHFDLEDFELLILSSSKDDPKSDRYPETHLIGKFKEEDYLSSFVRSTFEYVFGVESVEELFATQRQRDGTPHPEKAVTMGWVPESLEEPILASFKRLGPPKSKSTKGNRMAQNNSLSLFSTTDTSNYRSKTYQNIAPRTRIILTKALDNLFAAMGAFRDPKYNLEWYLDTIKEFNMSEVLMNEAEQVKRQLSNAKEVDLMDRLLGGADEIEYVQ